MQLAQCSFSLTFGLTVAQSELFNAAKNQLRAEREVSAPPNLQLHGTHDHGVFFKFHEHSSDVCGLCKEWEKYLKQFSKQLNSPFCLSLFTLDHVTKLHLCPINSIRFHSVQINRIILMRIKRTMCWGCPRTWIQTQTHLNKSVISTVYLHASVFAVVIFLLSSILHIPKVLIT